MQQLFGRRKQHLYLEHKKRHVVLTHEMHLRYFKLQNGAHKAMENKRQTNQEISRHSSLPNLSNVPDNYRNILEIIQNAGNVNDDPVNLPNIKLSNETRTGIDQSIARSINKIKRNRRSGSLEASTMLAGSVSPEKLRLRSRRHKNFVDRMIDEIQKSEREPAQRNAERAEAEFDRAAAEGGDSPDDIVTISPAEVKMFGDIAESLSESSKRKAEARGRNLPKTVVRTSVVPRKVSVAVVSDFGLPQLILSPSKRCSVINVIRDKQA